MKYIEDLLTKQGVIEIVKKKGSNSEEIIKIIEALPEDAIIEIAYNISLPIWFENLASNEQDNIYAVAENNGIWELRGYKSRNFNKEKTNGKLQ